MKTTFAISCILSLLLTGQACAQKNFSQADIDPEYTKVLTKRVDKFLGDLNLEDKAQYERVRDIIVKQYQGINSLEEQQKEIVTELGSQIEMEKPLKSAQIDATKKETEIEIFRLHTYFIAQLQTELSPEQVDMVKDGMTYGVLPRTYNGYLNLLPTLSEEGKRFILASLLEARELAMDKGSSDEKHATFGKYKGRINNYVSKLGYDMKKAEEELMEREKAAKEKINKKD